MVWQTNIPPHNLGEVIDGACCLLDNPNAGLDQLMEHIKGPDFLPAVSLWVVRVSAQLMRPDEERSSSEQRPTSNSIKMAVRELSLPKFLYMVNKARLIERIADLVKEKKVDQISNIRDESSRKGMKIVIELKRDANAQIVLNQLYSSPSFRILWCYHAGSGKG